MGALSSTHYIPQGDRKGPRAQLGEATDGERSGPPQGDRKGPHPAPHRPRPYYEDEKVITRERIIVRAGAVWSGVGTLAVALGGCNVSGREVPTVS